ncbi:MAG: sigma-70 family RNA polymerase sigma factor [Gemmatimonadota bacterium]
MADLDPVRPIPMGPAAQRDDSIADLFFAHARSMLTIALSVLHDIDDAEDAVQRAFIKLPADFLLRVPEGKHEAYLRTAVWNEALTILGQRKDGKRVPLDQLPEAASSSIAAPTLDEVLGRRRVRRALHAIIDELPARNRQLIHLKYFMRLPNAVIATILGVRPKRLEKLVTRTHELVRVGLARRGIADGKSAVADMLCARAWGGGDFED